MNTHDQKQLLGLYFLGPKGEQRKLFQEMVELINNDMVFWRRNFHPKDPPTIPYRSLGSPMGQECQETLIQSLVELLAELKMDLPFFSPRYFAHMTADVSMPGLLGYYAGLLYNANNVSAEASPVTLKYELEVGRQFARLMGYNAETSFGHITSGGTVANFESVFYNKASRFLPATMGLALQEEKLPWPSFLPTRLWDLLNIPLEDIPHLMQRFFEYSSGKGIDPQMLLKKYSPAQLGDKQYWKKLIIAFQEEIDDPVIIVPSTAHYSWSKSSHLFGIGRVNCLDVKIDDKLAMSTMELKSVLKFCYDHRKPIIQTVCVLGSTEFGSFDPLNEIIPLMKEWRAKGLYSPVHIDAAYGGYFKAMFLEGTRFKGIGEEAQRKLPVLNSIFEFIKDSDSFTIDPHKLGHTPYGAGVFVTKHGFTKEFIAEDADYCLTSRQDGEDESFPLGRYIMEGSKPGASATSVYFSNKLIPLNSDGYGGLLFDLIKDAQNFQEKLVKLNQNEDEFSRLFEVRPLTVPESNLVCFYVKPRSEERLSKINSFNLNLMEAYFPKPTNHIQKYDYFVSKTKLRFSKLQPEYADKISYKLERDDDSIQLIRLVFLNQWSNQNNASRTSYFDDFISQIKARCLELYEKD